MGDYMTKPMKQAIMEEILLKWLSKKVGNVEEPVAENLIDNDVLETLKQLTDGQHIDIIESYLEFARKAIADIVQAAQEGDAKSVRDHAHSLKASSKQLGAMKLGDLSGELESRGMSGSLGDIEKLIREFSDIGARVLAEFEVYLEEHK